MTITYSEYIKNKDKYNPPKKTATNKKLPKKAQKKEKEWYEEILNLDRFKEVDSVGDFFETVGNTALDTAGNAFQGIFQGAEGLSDFARNRYADTVDTIAKGTDAIGWNSASKTLKKSAKEAREIAKQNETQGMIDAWEHIISGDLSGKKSTEELNGYERIQDKSAIGNTGREGVQSIALNLTTAGLNAASGGALGLPLIAVSAAGNAEQEALQSGATLDEARTYGLLMGGIEAGTEMLFGGMGKISEGLGFGKGAVDDQLIKQLSKKMKSTALKNISTFAIKSIGEGGEEVLAGLGGAFAQKLTYMSEEDIKELIKNQDLMKSFIMGTLSSTIMQAPSTITSTAQGRDVNTGLTQVQQEYVNEIAQQRLIEAQKRNERLNGYQQMKIEDRALEDYQKGRIFDSSRLPMSDDLRKMDLQQSAYKYGINPNSEAVVNVKAMLDNRGVKSRFDADAFKNVNGNAFWSNKNGVREVIFNPNASMDTIVEEIAIHELTHDLMSSKNSKNVINNQKIIDYVSTLDGYKESKAKLEKLYANQTKGMSKQKANALINEEIIADTLGKNIGSQEYIRQLVDSEPSLSKVIYNWIVKTVNNLSNKNGVKKEKLYWENIKNNFEKAYNMDWEGKGKKTNTKYSFISEKGVAKAIESDKRNEILAKRLTEAKELKKQGYSNEEIRRKTKGWFQDTNGKWLFEISDTNVEINKLEKNKKYNIEEILPHEALYEAYPELKETKIETKGIKKNKNGDVTGQYDDKANKIYLNNATLNDTEEIRNVLLHEIQHKIQEIEGLESGTRSNKIVRYYTSLGEIQSSDVEARSRKSADYLRENMPEVGKEYPIHQHLKDIHRNINKQNVKEYLQKHPKVAELYNEIYNKGNEGEYDRVKINKKGTTKDISKTNEVLRKIGNWLNNNGNYESLQEELDNSSFSFENQLENQLSNILEEDMQTTNAMLDNFKSYLEEYDITNPTQEDIDNSLIDLIGYDNDMTPAETLKYEKQYKEVVNEYLKEQNQDIRYSLTDNQGRELTKEQQDYFKDSKVRDKNGSLEVVYHTMTNEGLQFNEFNPVGTEGYRFGDQVVNYYTSSKVMSSSYADQNYTKAKTNKLNNVEDALQWVNNLNETEKALKPKTFLEWKLEKSDKGYWLFYNDGTIKYTFETNEEMLKNLQKTWEKASNIKHKYQYEGYLNITNPYVVDAEGKNWNKVFTEVDKEPLNKINNLSQEKKEALIELAQESKDRFDMFVGSGQNRQYNDMRYELSALSYDELQQKAKNNGIIKYLSGSSYIELPYQDFMKKFNELEQKYINEGRSATTYFEKNYKEIIKNSPIEDLMGNVVYNLSKNKFSEESINYNFSKSLSTNDVVNKTLENNKKGSNYDGVIIKNVVDYGGESDTREPANIYITFASNQFKNVDNTNPTGDADIRYSQDKEGWQSFLDNNFESRGTKTKLGDIKLPGLQNTIQEEVVTQTQQALLPIANEIKELNKNLNKVMNPTEIAQLTPQDANTTPILPGINRNKVGDGKSKFFDNINNKVNMLTDEQKTPILSDEDVKYYDKITNKDSLDEAFARLQNGGATETLRWHKLANRDENGQPIHGISATDIAEGWILLKQYADNGDTENMVEVAKTLRNMGTMAGQTVQAFNIMSRLTPEGMVKYAQSELLEAYDNMVKNKSAKWIEENRAKFDLQPNEVQFIMDTMREVSQMEDGYDKRVKLAEIQKLMTDKLPPTKGAGVKAWMRISMLFNPKTQVRNVAGNALIAPVNYFGDLFASGADKLISKKTGVRTTGTTKLSNYAKGFKTGLYQSYNDFKKGINTRNIEGNRFELGEGKSFNDNNAIGKALNRVDSLLSFMLDAGDRGFYEASFVNSINNQMVLNNTTEITQEMIDIATQEALSRTWQDNNTYSKAVLGIRKLLNLGRTYGIGDILIPFAKTPANLTKAIVDYSPAGLVNVLVKGNNLRKSLNNGQFNAKMQHEFVQSLGKATAGTMLYVLGYALAKAGITTGESDEDKDIANFLKNTLGVSSYSIKIGDKSFTYDWAQPIAAPLTITANVVNAQKEDKEQALTEAIIGSLDSAGSTLLEQSFLQSINDVLNNQDGVISGLITEMLELPARAIPTFFKQIVDLTDGTQRQTFVKGKPIQSAVNSVIAKIPGLSYTLDPSVDTLGRNIEKYGGKNNLFNVFLNPANINTENISESAQEIYDVYKQTGESGVMPRVAPYTITIDGEKINLSSSNRTEYQRISGKIIEDNVQNLMNTSSYTSMSDTEKAEVIKNIVNYSYNVAQKELFGKELSDSYENAYEYSQIGDISDYYAFRGSIDDTNANTKKISIRDYLVNSYLNDEQIAYLYGGYYSSDKELNLMLDTGVSMKEFIKFNSEEFTSDYDRNGKAITNSRQNKIINYVNGLNLNLAQRVILIKTEYPSYDRYDNQVFNHINGLNYSAYDKMVMLKKLGFDDYDNEIISRVNNQNISKDEKIKILKEMGFTVRNGRVYS